MSTPDRFERARSGENLLGALAALRRRWVLALGVVVACVAVSVFSHEHKAKSYAATASVAFQSSTLSDSALQVTSGGSSEPQREADTEVLIAHSPEVAQRVRPAARHPRRFLSDLLEEVKVEAAPNADVLNLIATNGNPRQLCARGQRLRRTVHRLQGQSAARRDRASRRTKTPAADRRAAGRLRRTHRPGDSRCSASASCGRSPAAARASSGRATPPSQPQRLGPARRLS